MIEIHSHVCFGIDDGPADQAAALDLLQAYGRQGVRQIIATPHLEPQHYQTPADLAAWLNLRQQSLEVLQSQLLTSTQGHLPDQGPAQGQPPSHLPAQSQSRGQPEAQSISLYPGSEVMLSPDCLNLLKNDRTARQIALADSGYLLVELPRYLSGGIKVLDKLLFSIQLAGYTPILAHPERAMQDDSVLPVLAEWVNQDRLLLQINASSLVADPTLAPEQQQRYLRRRGYVRRLLDHRLVHFVASDAHHAVRRPPQNRLAWQALSDWYGPKVAERTMHINPGCILHDQPIR